MTTSTPFDLYEITGNTTPKRIGRLFPTGWTPVGTSDSGALLIATQHGHPYQLRGTRSTLVGSMPFGEVVRRQQ